jgi:hypothetical protein
MKKIQTPSGTYRVRTFATGRSFGFFSIVTRDGRRVHETPDVYPFVGGAVNAATRWIERREELTPGSLEA